MRENYNFESLSDVLDVFNWLFSGVNQKCIGCWVSDALSENNRKIILTCYPNYDNLWEDQN